MCVPNKTEYLSLRMFQSMFHENVNANLMKQNARHINGGIAININVSVKNIIYVKKIMLGILLVVVCNL